MDMFLKLLDHNYISNIYIGITGVFVAIVIFIAEIIKEQGNELNKKVILSKTKIKNRIISVLIVFIYMLFINMFDYHNDESEQYYLDNVFFFFTHIILLILVVLSTCSTGVLFYEAIRLNTERDYYNKELEKYVFKKVVILEKKANYKNSKKHRKEEKEFKNYIKKQKIYFCDKFNLKNGIDYIAIYPEKNGIVHSYNYKKLDEMVNFFNNQKISNKTYVSKNRYVVYIPNYIGKKVNKKEPVFYCLKESFNIFKNLSDTIIYTDNRLFIDDEIKLINKCLFELAFDYEEPDAYDENSRLYNYFKYLYDKKLYGIKTLALDNINQICMRIYDKYSKNRQFCIFLNRLSFLAYSNGELEDFAMICDVELLLYKSQFDEKDVDIKQITYNFVNSVFRFNLYSAKHNIDIRYYDKLISILYRFIIHLIKTSNYDSITVLLDNLSMESINYKDNDLDEYDKINFQFSCGIIECLIMLSEQGLLEDSNKTIIIRIINYLKNYLVNIYDAWYAITYFKKSLKEDTYIKNAYNKIDFELIDHKYKNSWGGWSLITSTKIIKELIYVFNISFIDLNSLGLKEIEREDGYYYKELLELITTNDSSKLSNYLNVKYDNSLVTKALKFAVDEAEEKEKIYNRFNKIDADKIEKFKKIIKQSILKGNAFTNELKKYGKIQKSKEKLKNVYGFNQLIPRNLFFKDIGGYESIAQNYCGTLDIGVEKEYIKKIEKHSKIVEDSLEEILNKLDNIQEYIIITEYIDKNLLEKYDYNKNTILFNNLEIPVINLPFVKGIILLKQQDLPTIYLCKFEDQWGYDNIEDSLFIELVDCSENETIRNEIIEKTEWIKEKGTIEDQNNYLKEHCRIRLFLAYTIQIDESAIIYNIIRSDNCNS